MATRGEKVAEGKTKVVYKDSDDDTAAVVFSKDDLTAGDGKRHEVHEGFGRLSNLTTCNTMGLLKACGIPVAFRHKIDEVHLSSDLTDMIMLEVVTRREAHGSFLKRHPYLKRDHYFPKLVFELFLKTTGKKWKGHDLPCDDPFMDYTSEPGKVKLYLPDQPLWAQQPFLTVDASEIDGLDKLAEIEKITRKVTLILDKALQMQGIRFGDMKIEFGITKDGRLVVSDVIDGSSWRIVGPDGKYIDKQLFRDGEGAPAMVKVFERCLEITSHFLPPPRQQIVIWTGSKDDDLTPFLKALKDNPLPIAVEYVALSAHKEPIRAVEKVQRLVQMIPDTVVGAYIGRSNGAGPIMSAAIPVPVLTSPVSVKEFHEDVWSSLRTPSKVPVATILEPSNLLLQAAQILAMRNPQLYAELRYKQEEQLANFMIIR